MRLRSLLLTSTAIVALVTCAVSCGEEGLLPTTVDPGSDFVQEDVIFDDEFYYCRVEPVLFQAGCGPGSGSDPANGCHFSVTKFRLTDYGPPRVDATTYGWIIAA